MIYEKKDYPLNAEVIEAILEKDKGLITALVEIPLYDLISFSLSDLNDYCDEVILDNNAVLCDLNYSVVDKFVDSDTVVISVSSYLEEF